MNVYVHMSIYLCIYKLYKSVCACACVRVRVCVCACVRVYERVFWCERASEGLCGRTTHPSSFSTPASSLACTAATRFSLRLLLLFKGFFGCVYVYVSEHGWVAKAGA